MERDTREERELAVDRGEGEREEGGQRGQRELEERRETEQR